MSSPMRFTSWHRCSQQAKDVFVRALGVSEVDIRDMRLAWNYDAYQVRTWNRRRLLIDGMTIVRFS